MAEDNIEQLVDPTEQIKRGVAVIRQSWFLLASMLLAGCASHNAFIAVHSELVSRIESINCYSCNK